MKLLKTNPHFIIKVPQHLTCKAKVRYYVHEFCNFNAEWPFRQLRKRFRSSQNAALLQYRIPQHGSFVASVKFIENPERMYRTNKKLNFFLQQNQFKSHSKSMCSFFSK